MLLASLMTIIIVISTYLIVPKIRSVTLRFGEEESAKHNF